MIRALLCAAALLLAGAPSYAGPNVDAEAQNFSICSGVNASLAAGTCTGGLFASGTVTNPTGNQVILGPIDTAGALSFSFDFSVQSGGGATFLFQEAESPIGPWTTATVQGGPAANVMSSAAFGNANKFSGSVKARYLQIVTVAGGTEVLAFNGWLRSAPFVPTFGSSLALQGFAVNALPTSAYSNGSTVALRDTSSGYGVYVPYSLPETTWQWSTNGTPISTATTTQIAAAGAAGVRNYLVQLYCFNTGASGSEVQILDGATVIWDGQIFASTTQPINAAFPVALRGSAATAISIKTLGTPTMTCSAQGYQAY